MADFPEINAPERKPFDVTDLFDSGQIDRAVVGINRGVDGFKQSLIEAKEVLGLVPEGTAEFETQEMLKEQEALREATAGTQDLSGAAGVEFAGEFLPLLAAPLGATIPRAVLFGAGSSAGFFQEDVQESRIDDILFGAGFGAAGRGLLNVLRRGGRSAPSKRDLDNTIDQLALPAPAARPGQLALPAPQRQLALPAPRPGQAQRALGADDFQLAGRDARARLPDGTPTRAAALSKKRAEALSRASAKAAEKARMPDQVIKALRKTEVATRNAARKEAAAARALQKALGSGAKNETTQKLESALTRAKQDKIAADVLNKAIRAKHGGPAVTPGARPAAQAAPAPAPAAAPRRLPGPAGASGLGRRQGGFAQSDLVNTAGGATLGAVGGGLATEGDPIGIAAGALGGGAVARALSKRLATAQTQKMKDRAKMREVSGDAGQFSAEVSKAVKAKDFTLETTANVLSGARKIWDQFLGATMTRLEVLSPRMAAALKEAEFQQHFRSGEWLGQGDKEWKTIRESGMTDEQSRRFKIIWLNNRDKGARYLSAIGKDNAAEAAKRLGGALDEMAAYLKGVGLGDNLRKAYAPRLVKDLDAFDNVEEVNTYLAQLAKKKGIKLTDFEKEIALTEVINGALTRGGGGNFARSASNLQKRTVKVDNKNVDAYADPHEAFNDYVESITQQVERRRFFQGQGVKTDDFGVHSENIDTIGDRLRKQLERGELDEDSLQEVVDLIKMRYGPGEQSPLKAVQNFKNLTYAGLLGNPRSAATQFGDLTLSLHRNGIRNTVSTVMETISGKGKLSGLDKQDLLGIRNAASDFASRTSTKDVTDWALKYSGFQAVDRFGKNTFIRSAMKKNKDLSLEEFRAKHGPQFDPDGGPTGATPRTDELYRKVQEFETITPENREDIAFMLFNDLAGVQPISLSALPPQYLANPNGRALYMLQSFTLKLFDVMRKDIVQNIKTNPKLAAKNAANLTSLFVLTNGGVDKAKDFMLGKDSTPDEIVVNNLLRMLGMNKFMFDSISRDGLGDTLLKTVAPPTAIINAIGDPREALKLAPPLGPVIESRIPE